MEKNKNQNMVRGLKHFTQKQEGKEEKKKEDGGEGKGERAGKQKLQHAMVQPIPSCKERKKKRVHHHRHHLQRSCASSLSQIPSNNQNSKATDKKNTR